MLRGTCTAALFKELQLLCVPGVSCCRWHVFLSCCCCACMQSFLVSLFLDCPPNLGLDCPNDTAVEVSVYQTKVSFLGIAAAFCLSLHYMHSCNGTATGHMLPHLCICEGGEQRP